MPTPSRAAVDPDELADAILKLIVERFGDRLVTWEVVQEATTLVNERVKMAALRAAGQVRTSDPAADPPKPRRPRRG